MIAVRFGGGLGNQLFQYAFLLTLEKEFPKRTIYYDDSSYLYFNEHDGFDLPKYFTFAKKKMPIEQLKQISYIKYFLIKHNFKIKNLKSFNIVYKIDKGIMKLFSNKYILINDKNVSIINQINVDKEIRLYFDGRWQNIKLYDLKYIKDRIRFNVKLNQMDMNIKKLIDESCSVSVHVRRGDFVNNEGFDICNINYYKTAINKLCEITGKKVNEFQFFFFGDDHKYILSNFENIQKEIVQGSSAGIDMYLMSRCKYHIIANSTFSFWGSFLDDKSGIVIAPQYSFFSKSRKEKFSIPNEWITIDNIREINEH